MILSNTVMNCDVINMFVQKQFMFAQLFPWLNSQEMSLHILHLERITSVPFVKVAWSSTPMSSTECWFPQNAFGILNFDNLFHLY